MKAVCRLTSCVLLSLCALAGLALAAPDSIPPGTVITMQNWQQYKQFMPEGMIELFEGKYFWKMPQDVQIGVGPTIIHPLPKGYQEATEKYAPQTKLVSLPNGGFTIGNYVAGLPFPNPDEPHKGWKILADLWYRYIPHLIVMTPENLGAMCMEDRYLNVSCSKSVLVLRQLKHNTDPGTPMDEPQAGPMDYTEWNMIVEPEQLKYSAGLTIFFTDLTQPEATYVFKPELRRAQEVSSLARCNPSGGSDITQDDRRFGFNGNITQFQSKLLGEKRILALTDYKSIAGNFPANYEMPLGWAKPSWGNWELRDTYMIDVRRLPTLTKGYCYGKRIMYVDKQFFGALWEDLYDAKLQLWKIAPMEPMANNVPGVGAQNVSGAQLDQFWDIQNNHSSYLMSFDPNGRTPYLNQEVPKQYNDVAKYSTPGGLNQIMR